MAAFGLVERRDEGFEGGEVLGESREMWVSGEERVGLGLELEEGVNGGRVGLGRVGTRVGLELLGGLF